MSNPPEKILGVLGGMGPAATAEFLRLLVAYAPAERDQEHPKVFMLSNPGVPDRTAAILDGGEQPTPWLKKGLFTLADWGADLLAVPCNTAHFFIDHIGEKLPVPLVHIVDATLTEAKKRSPEGSWLVGTSGTRKSGIYQSGAEKLGYPLYVPSAEVQVVIQTAITLVKANRIDEAEGQLRFALGHLRNRRDLPIVAACTEVPLAYIAGALPPEKMTSSLEALALSCLRELYGPKPPL
jgi:aspartate racemase